MIAPCFREAEISSPRDLVLLDPTQLVKFMEVRRERNFLTIGPGLAW